MVSYVFKRFELKYKLSPEQYRTVLAEIKKRLSPDIFGETTIQSLYFDTPDFRLVRASIERPVFKEKLRLRCYGLNDSDKDVFLEMKRKYDSVVYKRRIALKESELPQLMSGGGDQTQIGSELNYFIGLYPGLAPRMMILYDRTAFFDPESDLRVTFDRNVRYRSDMLDCSSSLEGEPLLEDGEVLLEIKCGTAYPLWLCKLLSENKIYKNSFSKYGAAYIRECGKQNDMGGYKSCLSQYSRTEISQRPDYSPLCSLPLREV